MTSLAEILQTNLMNASKVAEGQYSELLCVACRKFAVETFFSENEKTSQCGIWFECTSCKHTEHIDCRSRPPGFTSQRLRRRFQELDARAWIAEQTQTVIGNGDVVQLDSDAAGD